MAVEKEVPVFDTNMAYAPVAGWLIFPAIFSLLTFLGGFIMIAFVNPGSLAGFDLAIYSVDAFSFIYLLITYFFWFKRKKALPYLMIVFFGIRAGLFFATYVNGYGMDYLNLAISIVWIVYFIRSERVKQTFVY